MPTPRTNRLSPLVLAVLAVSAGCGRPGQSPSDAQTTSPADRRAADESAIRATDSAWVAAVASKNPAQAASYYTDDAVLFVPGEPMMSGKDAITKGWSNLMPTPGFALTFAPDKVVVVGDMAYEVGNYEMTTNGKDGKPQTSKAKYVVVWTRQPDGSWKAALDAPTTSQ